MEHQVKPTPFASNISGKTFSEVGPGSTREELLSEIIRLHREVADARDEAYELRRDGQAAIDEQKRRADGYRMDCAWWRAKHRNLGAFSALSVLINAAAFVAVVWAVMR
jgi:hypothetical protein